MMKIKYTKHINTYDPVSISWEYQGKDVEIDFNTPITGVYSEPLSCVVVEVYSENLLNFYSLDGGLISSERLPELENYQFRGITKSIKSKTGVSFLFHPSNDQVGNKWGDTEQYELTNDKEHRLGQNIGIYR
ncbi:MAG: hypothetical protein GY938_05295 [Ketobacter sp.]|nr:hypothetical protein [Ketobacter sp.]